MSQPAVHGDASSMDGRLAVASVTLGLVIWPIAFNLGAYGQIFYTDVFRLVVASSILLAIVAVNPPYATPWIWFVRVALASPLVWLLVAGYVVGSTTEAMRRGLFVAWLVLTVVVSVPLSLRLLIDLFTPQVARTGSPRTTAAIVALVAAVGVIGFVAGRENPRFMTCADFAVAGSSEPQNCVRSTPSTGRP